METVIIQETDQLVLEILTMALEFEGFEVYSVSEPNEDFLALIEEAKPDVVMLDYKLRGESSIKFCKNIKRNFPRLPILAASSNNDIDQEYRDHGFDDYIKKPFDLEGLYTVIRKYARKPDTGTEKLV